MENKPLLEDSLAIDGRVYPPYLPGEDEQKVVRSTLNFFTRAYNVCNKGYNYFGGGNLYEAIDDWTKRWNGYIPPMNPLLDATQSNIFINFTRNAIVSYLSKAALSPVEGKIIAVNKKNGLHDLKFSQVLEDLNKYSLNNENAPQKFLRAALECVVKGTVVVYEGYMKQEQEMRSPVQFDSVTGKVSWKKTMRTLFDDCYQEVVPLEDFFIVNAWEPDMQKQPAILWRKLTSYEEAEAEFAHYKNWKYVQPGAYAISWADQTFYRDAQMSSIQRNQCEVLRYYCRSANQHVVIINGVVMYDGPIPFKDGRYPFAKAVNEPFANDFFWGNGSPNKYMGEQDLINSFINAMADKTINSLLPTGLSSDLDDLIEDDTIEMGKFRKVGDINKWKWFESPGVNGGEMNMFQNIMQLAQQSGSTDAGDSFTPNGGKLQTRQILLQQQEQMQKLSFNMNFLEDLERDRTELRVAHILQFYSIPKIERITGQDGKDVEGLVYREVSLPNTTLSDGRKGTKLIKVIGGEYQNPDMRTTLENELSVREVMGDMMGTPTEAMAVSIDTFNDFNNSVQVVKYSSYEKNQALDQAARMEFAQWRMGIAPVAPIPNVQALVEWVEEAFDIDTDLFETAPPQAPQQQQMPGQMPQQPGQPPQPGMPPQGGAPAAPAPGGPQPPQPLQSVAPSAIGAGGGDLAGAQQ